MTKNSKLQENRLSNLQYTFKHFLNVTGSDGLTSFIFISDLVKLDNDRTESYLKAIRGK